MFRRKDYEKGSYTANDMHHTARGLDLLGSRPSTEKVNSGGG